jgi:hypothetical protein
MRRAAGARFDRFKQNYTTPRYIDNELSVARFRGGPFFKHTGRFRIFRLFRRLQTED